MRLAWLVLLLAGCQDGGSGDDYPIRPGGTVGSSFPAADAAVSDGSGDAGAVLAGRVCLITDLRDATLPACADTNAGGLTVTLGAQTAITAADGAFTIPPATGANLVWRVTGAGVVPAVMKLGTTHVIPIVGESTYLDLLLANGVILASDQGSIFGRVIRQAEPLANATVELSPAAVSPAFYDGPTATTWRQDATGSFGAFWVPGAASGTATLTAIPELGTSVEAEVRVEEQALTFVTVELP